MFFVRQGISVPLRLLGKRINFEEFGADVGGLSILEDARTAPFVVAIRDAIRDQIGGMTEVTEQGFLDAKKAASDAQKLQEQRAAQSSIGSPFNQDPRLAVGADPFGKAPAAPVEQINVSLPSGPTLAPTAEVDPSRVYLTSQSFPKPITNDEYKDLFGTKVNTVAPPITEAPKRGKASAIKG